MSTSREYTKSEYKSLAEIAQEYQEQGYTVSLSPSAQDLPDLLADCSIDLIASRDYHTVAVSVRSKDTLTLTGRDDLREITTRVNQQPGWEFELVVADSQDPSIPSPPNC
ncbi:MAG: hypothetical protein AAGA75_26595 [Cyanobacteria bacterium P01_E01_bin.6]